MATLRQFKNGRWQAQVRRRGIVPVTKTFTTKPDAERWATLIESEIDRGVFVDRSKAERTTVGELIERYLVEVTPSKKSARSERQRLLFLAGYFARHTAAGLGGVSVRDIKEYGILGGKESEARKIADGTQKLLKRIKLKRIKF